jgi:hypothetical protein
MIALTAAEGDRASTRAIARPRWIASPWIVFGAIVGASNWPLLAHVSTHVVGAPQDDAFEVLWLVEWARKALFSSHVSPLHCPDVFWPRGWQLAGGSEPVWWIAAMAPLAQCVGATAAYNLVTLGTFVVMAVGTYRFCQSVQSNRFASFVAAIALITAPALTMRKAGHFNVLLASAWLPWTALHARLALIGDASRRNRHAVLAGVFLALCALGHWQFVYLATLLPAILYCAVPGTTPIGAAARAKLFATTAVVAALLVLPAAILSLRAWTANGGSQFPLSEVDHYSVSLDRLCVPSPLHPLYGSASRARFPIANEADVVSVGYAVLALVAVGLVTSGRKVSFLCLVVLAGAIVSLGPTLHWRGRHVCVPAPQGVAARLNASLGDSLEPELRDGSSRTPLPLPVALVRTIVPGAATVRAWSRAWILVSFGLAILAGVGCHRLCTVERFGPALAAVLAIAVVFEGLDAPYPNLSAADVNRREADEWLRGLPERRPIVEYPLPDANLRALDSQRRHGLPLVNGAQWMGSVEFRELEASGRWPTEDAVRTLRSWGVEYLIANAASDAEAKAVGASLRTLGLRLVRSFADAWPGFSRVDVYSLRP